MSWASQGLGRTLLWASRGIGRKAGDPTRTPGCLTVQIYAPSLTYEIVAETAVFEVLDPIELAQLVYPELTHASAGPTVTVEVLYATLTVNVTLNVVELELVGATAGISVESQSSVAVSSPTAASVTTSPSATIETGACDP